MLGIEVGMRIETVTTVWTTLCADYAHILSNQKIWQYLGTYNVRTVQSTRTLMVW